MPSEPPSPSSSTSSFLPTTTLLAIPDGPIASSSKDGRTHLTSIIGGYPTFPSLPTSSTSSNNIKPEEFTCLVCKQTIPLLTQVYCPPEGGENDRNVYVFACPRSACQRKAGRYVHYSSGIVSFYSTSDDALNRIGRPQKKQYRMHLRMRTLFLHRFSVPSCTSLCSKSSCLYMFALFHIALPAFCSLLPFMFSCV
jgi:hypothetical protein